MPNRTTRDYEGPAVAPTLQAVLESALRGEDDLTLDARYAVVDTLAIIGKENPLLKINHLTLPIVLKKYTLFLKISVGDCMSYIYETDSARLLESRWWSTVVPNQLRWVPILLGLFFIFTNQFD